MGANLVAALDMLLPLSCVSIKLGTDLLQHVAFLAVPDATPAVLQSLAALS